MTAKRLIAVIRAGEMTQGNSDSNGACLGDWSPGVMQDQDLRIVSTGVEIIVQSLRTSFFFS
jgi:hypothetical protein